jgi:hypothetical protein
MPQHFSRRADRYLRLFLVLGPAVLVGAAALAFALARSDGAWAVGRAAPQPIPFSHALHAGGLGLDCRFCHAGVERGAEAGMPTASLCLGCHAQVWNGAAVLAPLHDSLALGAPIAWASVHRLPDHARFHHGLHVAGGVACETCHGRVWEMPRTVKAQPMSMGWCLDCHRAPEARSRPSEAVFDRHWRAAPADASGHRPGGIAAFAARHAGMEVSPLTRCSTCHR